MKLPFEIIHIKDWDRTYQSLLDKKINVKKIFSKLEKNCGRKVWFQSYI